MIFYFSATGNCKYVAGRIAKATNDKAVSIEKQEPQITIKNGEVLGFVMPVYYWQAASPMSLWLEKLSVQGGPSYVFTVVTFGTITGCAAEQTKRLLRKCGVKMDAAFGVRMPDTWTPMFDLSNPVKVKRQNDEAEARINRIIRRIKLRDLGNRTFPRVPYLLYAATEKFEEIESRTKNFHVEDSCIGCGLCARRCPMQAIEMQEGKPVWIKDHCACCLRCLHHCPKFAIQYGKNTKKHGQYRNPHVKV